MRKGRKINKPSVESVSYNLYHTRERVKELEDILETIYDELCGVQDNLPTDVWERIKEHLRSVLK